MSCSLLRATTACNVSCNCSRNQVLQLAFTISHIFSMVLQSDGEHRHPAVVLVNLLTAVCSTEPPKIIVCPSRTASGHKQPLLRR